MTNIGNYPVKSKKINDSLKKTINQSEEFANTLQETLGKHHTNIEKERQATVEILGPILQKWVVEIIHTLFIEGAARFNNIKRKLHGISSRTLTTKLRLLEDTGFLKRELVSERPVVFEYKLSEKGMVIATLSSPIIFYLKLEKASE